MNHFFSNSVLDLHKVIKEIDIYDGKLACMFQDKAFGKIIHRHGGSLVLYRGRNYNPKKIPVIPLMLWKPQEPTYPKLIKTTIEGLSIEETKEMRKKGLAVPALIKLGNFFLFNY